MKIALIGYGKMGKVIEEIAITRNHEIVSRFTTSHPLNENNWVDCDVAIEFTNPESAAKNIEFCLTKGVPICIGSTGWYDQFEALSLLCKSQKSAMLAATNFSIGVNLYWKIAEYSSKLFSNIPNYKFGISEIHHTEKKDSPSGTAITLAEKFITHQTKINDWHLEHTRWEDPQHESTTLSAIGNNSQNHLPIVAYRNPEVPGTHQLFFLGDNDFIKIEHQAINRRGFAEGAVLAAEWIRDKKGVFNMSDMLKFEE